MKDRIKDIQNILIKIYTLLIFGLLPLVVHKGYHDMGDIKFAFFRGASVLLFDAIIILFVISFIKSSDLKTFFKIRLRTADYFAICFLVFSFISFLRSSYKEDALWGFESWNMGLLSQLLFVFIFFCVSRSDDAGDIVFYVSGVAGTIVSVIAILQRFGFDPFGFYRGIEDVYRHEFLSTIGQKTWFSSYLMIAIPMSLHLFATVKNKTIGAL
nr:hypothetical protein [Lachnospiraceae bacterium]